MFGVSPAFFFSQYTTDFTVEEYIEGLDELKRLGLEAYQTEVFHPERLDEWLEKGAALYKRGEELGLTNSQFVAHFMLYTTKDEESLFSDCGYEDMRKIVEICKLFNCKVITLPVGPYQITSAPQIGDHEKIWKRFCEKISVYCDIAKEAGMVIGMEIVPGSILSNTDNLLRLISDTKKDNLGLNFDTGHAWSTKERIELIPSKLAGKIYGTHFKDNFGFENLPLPPGKGSIPWALVIDSLLATGYKGSLDLEIVSKKEEVAADYMFGKEYLLNNCNIK